jgi:hypothetical protein
VALTNISLQGLSLEQVDKMMEETTPRTSAKWKPTTTFAGEMGMADDKNVSESQIERTDENC